MHADDVLAFLDSHPDFLVQHAERLNLPEPSLFSESQRGVIPLAERQLLGLRDRNRQLEARLHQLVRHGEANDLIIRRSHRMAVQLLRGQTPATMLQELRQCFANEFGLDRFAIRVWHDAAARYPDIYNSRHDIQALARNLAAPYCGPYVNDEVMGWFPPTPVLQSFAQVALRDDQGQPFGLMVLASDDAERFTFDMHTHYLAQMGELVATGLLRVLTES
ncbi:DUF484 family protein [Paludibacterium denitrificans]|uniref:DUF484 family protein n=1 Tax=Paludibacterium denitrificans TaxID=2675226 RepID=A0A844GE46_9NEIS|nr:DUF484 family protein [Paludibacterium denitrificans]MTD33919.1 DUF484 family protein [Paludibacterium denitrificans]HJV07834.1 DUF484 family protein [Chromobacteriaceae bacterium]